MHAYLIIERVRGFSEMQPGQIVSPIRSEGYALDAGAFLDDEGGQRWVWDGEELDFIWLVGSGGDPCWAEREHVPETVFEQFSGSVARVVG